LGVDFAAFSSILQQLFLAVFFEVFQGSGIPGHSLNTFLLLQEPNFLLNTLLQELNFSFNIAVYFPYFKKKSLCVDQLSA